jgi:DNA (cytosine-5)-methyltransferase 1
VRIGGLFFGYGGLDMAVMAALGGELAWLSEIDPGACKVIGHRYPGVPNLGDVTAIDWATVPPVDAVTGGSPCQDVSQAGQMAGMRDGTRSGLWAAMRDGIAALRPSLVIWENVRGVFSADADSALEHCPGCMGGAGDGHVLRALGRVLGDLSDLGYDARWHGLHASDIGACHGRFRVFVAAYPRGEHGPERRLPTPREAAGGWSFGEPPGRDRAPVRLLPTPRAREMEESEESFDARQVRLAENGRTRGDSGRPLSVIVDFHEYAEAVERWEGRTRPAPPPRTPGRDGKPRLNPAFSEWMMGLPNGWVTGVPGITRPEALRVIGNGVVPQQGEAALRHMFSGMRAASNKSAVTV